MARSITERQKKPAPTPGMATLALLSPRSALLARRWQSSLADVPAEVSLPPQQSNTAPSMQSYTYPVKSGHSKDKHIC